LLKALLVLLLLLAVAGGGELAGHGGVHRFTHLLSIAAAITISWVNLAGKIFVFVSEEMTG
jgi:hypothetical protein